MFVRLLAFAQARTQLGWSERAVECEPADTPRALLARVAPGFVTDGVRVAVDCEYCSWDEAIGEAAEMAIIPPVSGG